MRRGVLGLLALVLLAAGCGDDSRDSGSLAATEGRACQAIEFDAVERVLGVRFDTAGGARHDETYTCVLGQAGHPFPDLTLAMSATDADELIFRASLTPSGSTPVPDLGRIAYQVELPATTAADGSPSGPRLEVGWLSVGRKLLFLRYTSAPGETVADVAPKLIALAHKIEAILATPATLALR